jgi:glycosyltransferase involved in cell wall biosynthesis
MPPIIPPDLAQPDRHGGGHAPSWSGASGVGGKFINVEHRAVFEATRGLPGWQDPPDSHKLYETAYFNGSVILEIGVYGGRSAVVALRGARAGAADGGLPTPQFYGLDIDSAAMKRGHDSLCAAGLAEHAILFHGDLSRFLMELPVTPSMVFIDGDHAYPGCWADLHLLASRLVPGTPVLCHDYGWLPGVRRAVDESIRAGAFEKMGQFATSVLLKASNVRVPGRPMSARGLTQQTFGAVRGALQSRYFGPSPGLRTAGLWTPTRDVTAQGRVELTTGSFSAARNTPEDLPPLTVITPTLNCAGVLAETIASVVDQDYPGLEHVVVDRGSTDGTVDVARAHGRCLTSILADPGVSYTGKIRAALRIARGRRIVWIEGGEVASPDALWTIGEALAAGSEEGSDRVPIESLLPTGSAWLGGRVFHPDDFAGRRAPVAPHEVHQLAYHHGGVILAPGLLGGRSGLIELRGALAAACDRGLPPPQFYGVDRDVRAVIRARRAFERAGLSDRVLLYRGSLDAFLAEVPITPTLVVLDGLYSYDECRAVLRSLRRVLAPGTPLVARQYFRSRAVHRAIDEAMSDGEFGRIGSLGGMLLTCGSCDELEAGGGRTFAGRGLSEGAFAATSRALMGQVAVGISADGSSLTTAAARRELIGRSSDRQCSGAATWPYARTNPVTLPATMPSGRAWPRISVITPSFNQGRYIEETILSIRNQGYPDVEHIVMDGGSTDQTLDIIDRYRDGLAHVISQGDKGQSDAINRGFKLATGEVLTWLNSDDLLAEGALAAVAMALDQSGADMVAGECHIHRNGKVESRHLTACDNGPLPLEDMFDIDGCWLEGQFFYQPEVMFTRRIWERAGGHVREDLYHSMDYELWLRMAAAGAKLHVIGRPVALFRAHDEQKTAGDVVGGFRAELPRARDAFIAREGLSWSGGTHATRKGPLRIVLFNDLGFAYGAGIAHRRMAEAFLHAGHEVFPVAASLTDYHGATPRATHEATVHKIASYSPDLVVVGNMHGAALEPALLGAIAARFKTVFMLHDQWLLTGRCAYTGGCRKYLDRCDGGCSCPLVHPTMNPDQVGPAWESKRRVLGGSANLALWANSDWLNDKAGEALGGVGRLAGPEPKTIKFGFELDTFRPRDKSVCRELLGLPRDKFIIMSSASSVADPRKGLAHLAEALALLRLEDVVVVCVGWFGDREEPPIPGMRAMGYMKDPRRLAQLYGAADLFVGPSLEEAFGQVFIEAAACGTPSIGYHVGGIPEAIKHGVSGLLASAVEPRALAAAIGELYRDRERRLDMGRWGRLWVENEWSMSASYRRMFHVLKETGWGAELGMGQRLNLVVRPRPVPEVSVVGAMLPGWRAVSGFDHWEGPYPDRGIGRCRWALGPNSIFEVESEHAQGAMLIVSCRSYHRGQRIRLIHEGEAVGEREFAGGDDHARADRVLSFEVRLRAGPNRFELQFWKWAMEQGQRPMAILVTGITAVPTSGRAHSVVEGKMTSSESVV